MQRFCQRCVFAVAQGPIKIGRAQITERFASNSANPILRKVRSSSSGPVSSGYLLLSVPIATFFLGTWQVKRRQWKLDLIKMLEDKVQEPPIDLPQDLDELDNLEYRKVKVRGTFDHSKEMYIFPRTLLKDDNKSGGGLISSSGQTGSHVVTPFHLSDRNVAILVNRGWIPKNKASIDKTNVKDAPDNEVEIVGVVRLGDKRSPFMPENKPSAGLWYYRDVEAMATMCNTAPVFLDADRNSTTEGGPIGGQTRVSLRNEHFSYIVTWYSLSAATSYMWYRKFYRGMPV